MKLLVEAGEGEVVVCSMLSLRCIYGASDMTEEGCPLFMCRSFLRPVGGLSTLTW